MVSQGINIWNRVVLALCDNFRHCDFLSKIGFSSFWPNRVRPGYLIRRWMVNLSPLNFSSRRINLSPAV